MNTAISLQIEENESVEKRLEAIVSNIDRYIEAEYWIFDIGSI